MKIAMIGGSGFVGTAMRYVLRDHGHEIKVVDVNEPNDNWHSGFKEASVLDLDSLKDALQGVDAVMYLAMVPEGAGGHGEEDARKQKEINVTGLDNTLAAAKALGIKRALYASTLNVYHNWSSKKFLSEDNPPPDAKEESYGRTKIEGEKVCREFGDAGMTVTALRLCGPRPDKEIEDLPSSSKFNWQTDAREGYTYSTAITDVAAAAILSLKREDRGFKVYFATGDYEERKLNQSRIKRDLGWFPRARLDGHGRIYFVHEKGLHAALSAEVPTLVSV